VITIPFIGWNASSISVAEKCPVVFYRRKERAILFIVESLPSSPFLKRAKNVYRSRK
jgi:hypothetical protein